MQQDAISSRVNDFIRRVWYRLSEEEMKARTEARDIFYLAVRKKHGIARAQAELFVSELERALDQALDMAA